VSQSTVSRQLDAGIHEMRSRLRARGVLCGMGFAALTAAHSAEAAPVSLQATLGKLALSGVGASSSSQVPTLTSTLLVMKTSKIALATLAVAAALTPPLLLLHKAGVSPQPAQAVQPVKSSLPTPTASQPKKNKATNAAPPAHLYQPPPVSAEVSRKVDALIRHCRGMTREQLVQDEEINRLMEALARRADLNSPEMRSKMDEMVKNLQAVTGIQHGTVQMDLGEPDSPEFRALLEAIYSEDPQRAQDWFLQRVAGATFEFSVNPNLERTSDGVSLACAPSPHPTGVAPRFHEAHIKSASFA
jgi:hypothetical protein